MELFVGRPLNCEGRLEKEIRVYDFLDKLGVEYYRVDHESAGTMEECLVVEKVLDNLICKNLFLCNRQKTRFYLLVMDSRKHFVTKDFSPKVNSSRLSFGTPEDLEKMLDLTPGSVSIMGLICDTGCDVSLVIDKDLLEKEYFSCHPCINTSSIKIKTKDLIEKIIPALGHTPTFVEV
jgi:Ala-tRNA(Pro) deacylase